MRWRVEELVDVREVRRQGLPADGNSVVVVTDAAGRRMATIDPVTRERKNLAGVTVGTHEKLAPGGVFVHRLFRPRPAASIAELLRPVRRGTRSKKG
jgi:hypothetical protein